MIDFKLYPRKENTVYIYVLVDPRDDMIRYVGKTINLRARYACHCCPKEGNGLYVKRWLKQLKDQNLYPVMELLEICTDDIWKEREIYWIAMGKELNWPITNLTKGGETTTGYKHTEETKRIIGEKSKAKIITEETRQRNSKAKKGVPITEQHRENIRISKLGNKNAVGCVRTEAFKEARRISSRANPTKAKLSMEDIKSIRILLSLNIKIKDIAKMYEVCPETIYRIKNGITWSHIE